MKHSEILDFIVSYIGENGRGKAVGGYCEYLTKEGKRCAHSICIDDTFLVNNAHSFGNAENVIDDFGDDIHKPEFRGKSIDFWLSVQILHDDDFNWNENNTLSEQGITRLNELKLFYTD